MASRPKKSLKSVNFITMQKLRWFGWFSLGLAGGLLSLILGFRWREAGPERVQADDIKKLETIINLVERYYYRDISQSELVLKAINGMFKELDPHSFYIPREVQEQEEAEMSGGFEGIGIEFQIVQDTIMVVAPIAGGPSEMLGIQSGDRIVRINGRDVAGKGITTREVVKSLRGPKGTKVRVTILRPGLTQLLEYEITRDRIPIHAVSFAGILENGTGYIRLTRFSETSHEEVRKAIQRLKAEGMKGLILDLRGNPGGYLHMAQRIADEFLPANKLIVYTKGRVPESNTSYSATGVYNLYEQGPLIVMIGPGSASASEIVAGAVQDWDRGLIVGQRSFGKGVVQTQRYLPDSSAVRITFSRYFTPSGRCIQKPFENLSPNEYEEDLKKRQEEGELYDETKIKLPDSLKYKTSSGRIVYGGGGIIPDIFLPIDTSMRLAACAEEAQRRNLYLLTAQEYVNLHPELKKRYSSASDFAKNYQVTSDLWALFEKKAKEAGLSCNLEEAKADITWLLRSFVGKFAYGEDARTRISMERDKNLQQALLLLPAAEELEKTGRVDVSKYKALLRGK
jgi:carboxyl-terminal processing protease